MCDVYCHVSCLCVRCVTLPSQLHRLLMICEREQDDDDDENELVAVAINNIAYICRDLGVERFAPFLEPCIKVIASMLERIPPPSDDDGDDRCA